MKFTAVTYRISPCRLPTLMVSFFLVIVGFSQTAFAHVPRCSAFGAYTNLIQTIDCPQDQREYGNYSNYGYYQGGDWCGYNTSAGYWVYNYPTWHIYRNKVAAKKMPSTPQATTNNTYNGRNWGVYLKGKHLLYLKTTAYSRKKWHFWLCSNQRFQYSAQGGAVDVGSGFSAASQGGNSGQWQVSNNTLTLRYNNGSIENYNLSYSDDTLYLNNSRYFLVENNYCN